MRRMTAVIGAVLCTTLVLGTAPSASAKPGRKKYVVSASFAVPGTPVVGDRIKVTGRVRGAVKQKVQLQRRLGSGRWTRAAVARTDRKGRYRVAVRLTHAGPTALRVVKPRSRTRKAGVSRARTMVVQKWLDIPSQPHALGGGNTYHLVNHPVVVGGRRFDSSFQAAGFLGPVAVSTLGRCSRLELFHGVRDADRSIADPAASAALEVYRVTDVATLPAPQVVRTPTTRPGRYTFDISRTQGLLLISDALDAAVSGADRPVWTTLGSPRVLCTMDRLPAVDHRLLHY